MKKLLIVLLFWSALPEKAVAQVRCQDFHTGKFRIEYNGSVTYIERDKNFQTEVSGRDKLKLKITWLDSCTYRMQPVSMSKSLKKKLSKEQQRSVIITRITGVSDRYYVQESWDERDPEKVLFRSKIYRND